MRPPGRLDPVQAPVIPWLNHSLAPAHPGTLSLAQGIPWFGPPAEALAALRQAPTHGNYGPSPGLPALLEALRAKLEQDNGITEVPGIMVTAGSNMAFYYTVLAATRPGDEIILPLPYYFNHEMAAVMAGVRVRGVAPGANGVPDPGDVEQAINPATRAVITVSPNNPTGVVYPQQTLRAINRLCRRYGLLHISDEAYEYFTYGGQRHYSPAAGEDTADCTVSLFSFSKGYGMAGWRVGYVVYPERLAQAMAKIQDTVLIAPPVPCQLAALAALGAGRRYCQERLPPLEAARARLLELVERCGGAALPGSGAFYLYARFDTRLSARALVEWLVREHRVLVVPGDCFGTREGCWLRLSYGALGPDGAPEALARLERGLGALPTPAT